MLQSHFAWWPRHLSHHLPVPRTTLSDNLEVSARRYPDRIAIDFYGEQIRYQELKQRVDALAGYLQNQCGVRAGDRVLLDMQNSPAFIIAYYAILRADAAVVPINPMNLAEEIAHLQEDSAARVALVAQELYPQFRDLLASGRLQTVIVAAYSENLPAPADSHLPAVVAEPVRPVTDKGAVSWSEALAGQPVSQPARSSADDLAMLVYTSGTTGSPKGCMLSHRALNAAIACLHDWNLWTSHAVVLATAPFFHVTGMAASMNLPILCGGKILLMARWDRDLAAQLIHRHRASHWTNVPTMVMDLLAIPDIQRFDFSSLHYIGGGGSAMPEAVATRLTELTGLEYQEGWGLTEVAGAIHLNPPGHARRQCLGIPTFDVDTRVIDVDTLRPLGANETGELVTHCPSLFDGYWQRPEATAEAFIELDGKRFFRTGDIGFVDDDGFFYMADRLKRMINASGFKVWPAEVEAILFGCPNIQEACIVGKSDPQRGETVKAFVVLADADQGTTEADIIAWAREHMAAYKIPREIEFVDSLPKSGTGKVQWRKLQEQESVTAYGQ